VEYGWTGGEWERRGEVRKWKDVPLQAVRHLGLPVDLWVVIVQPVVPQDQALLPKLCDGLLCMLRVVLIA
jgi:hypothetical protein